MTTIEPAFADLSTQPRHRSFSEVYSDALRGESCSVRGIYAEDHPLPVHDWLRPVNDADRALLEHCRGATLDVGCGPGRMSAHLAEGGHVVMGVDIVREAVEQATRRGVHALRRNVFDPLPGEGAWNTVLLADGNIGIGGAPVRLLSLGPGGTGGDRTGGRRRRAAARAPGRPLRAMVRSARTMKRPPIPTEASVTSTTRPCSTGTTSSVVVCSPGVSCSGVWSSSPRCGADWSTGAPTSGR